MDAKSLSIATYACLGGGLAFLAISYLIPLAISDQGAWSEENASEFAQSGAEVHRLTHERSHAESGDSHADHSEGGASKFSEAELEAARQRFAKNSANLDSAVAGRQRFRTILRWIGISAAAAGIGLVVYMRLNGLEPNR